MMKGCKLQALGYSFVLFVLLSTLRCALYPIFAADSTPSADSLRQSDSEAGIKIKLEELKKEIASKAAKLKQEVDRKLKNKAYVGKIKSKSGSSLTLAAPSGPKVVNINEDTVFESNLKTKPKFSAKNIALEDYVACLGDRDETGVLIAKKIILLKSLNTQPKIYLWGQIISISDELATLKTSERKNVAVAFSSAKIKLNDFVILTGTKNDNDIFETEFVYVIPQEAVLKPKKIATASAKIITIPNKSASRSASPSAIPAKSATKKPTPTAR